MGEKANRGLKNVVAAVAEIPRGMSQDMDEEPPVYGAIMGIFKGSGKAVVRALSGIYDIIVAPVPNAKTFPPDPETLFSPEQPVDTGIDEVDIE
jgi:putative exosortase-associated protein (TIGR04073 family)